MTTRIKRAEDENRRIGFPGLEERIETLERLVKVLSTAAGVDPSELNTLVAKMDQMDIDFPDFKVFHENK